MSTLEWKKNNPEKIKKARRDYYYRNRESEIKRVKDRVRSIKEWFRSFKASLSCACGESHPACLDFHHENPADKTGDVSMMVHYGFSKNRILQEISKCLVLCSNCHRKRHH